MTMDEEFMIYGVLILFGFFLARIIK